MLLKLSLSLSMGMDRFLPVTGLHVWRKSCGLGSPCPGSEALQQHLEDKWGAAECCLSVSTDSRRWPAAVGTLLNKGGM